MEIYRVFGVNRPLPPVRNAAEPRAELEKWAVETRKRLKDRPAYPAQGAREGDADLNWQIIGALQSLELPDALVRLIADQLRVKLPQRFPKAPRKFFRASRLIGANPKVSNTEVARKVETNRAIVRKWRKVPEFKKLVSEYSPLTFSAIAIGSGPKTRSRIIFQKEPWTAR